MNLSVAARIVISIVLIILAFLMVPRIASLAVAGANFLSESITALFRPFTLSGEARLEGLVKMCLYLIIITFLIRFLLRR